MRWKYKSSSFNSTEQYLHATQSSAKSPHSVPISISSKSDFSTNSVQLQFGSNSKFNLHTYTKLN